MTRKTSKLGIQTLEARDVPATVTGGELVITGGSGNDTVLVDNTTVSGVAKVRVTQNGSAQTFTRSTITQNRVVFKGNDGHDSFNNDDASLKVEAYGGNGRDTLEGSNLPDYLSGGPGDDTLVGRGETDLLYGGDGNDRLFGESGLDFLYGDANDDYLDGGTGADYLNGGSGRDGLLGGPGDESDNITGGTGQDRFLDWTDNFFGAGETRTDVKSEDAVVFFRNTGETKVTLGSNMGERKYTPGTWTAAEIESVDKGLVILQKQTGNTRLLKLANGGSETFYKVGTTPGDPAGGWNDGSGIYVTQAAATTGSGGLNDAGLQGTVVHEVGHNWDTEHADYQKWLNLSGWEAHIPGFHDLFPPVGKVKSDDGRWWRRVDAQFARDYGKMNPMEDFATCWERFFGLSGNFNDPNLSSRLKAKRDHIQRFMDSI